MKRILLREISITKIVRIVGSIIFLLLLLIFFLSQIFIQKTMEKNTREDWNDSLSSAISSILEDFSRIQNRLYMDLSGSEGLTYVESGKDINYIRLMEAQINQDVLSIIANEALIDFCVYYAPYSQTQTMLVIGGTNPILKDTISSYVIEEIDSMIAGEADGNQLQWDFLYSSSDFDCWVHYYKLQNSYLCIVTELDTLLDNIPMETDEDMILTVYDQSSGAWASTGENLEYKGFLSIKQSLSDGGLQVSLWISHEKVYEGLYIFRMIFAVGILLLIGIFCAGIKLLDRFITGPVVDMTRQLNQVGEDVFDQKIIVKSFLKEYQVLAGAYNAMLVRIEKLMVDNYEKQVAAQKAQFQYLQLQMKPHFYLNVLNIIYSMAQVKDYDTIQKLTLSMVGYSRYMYKDATTLVRLSEELDFVENYVNIQKIRYMSRISYEMKIDDQYMTVLVPPYIIQCFVENSVKYGNTYREVLKIIIDAQTYKNSYIKITIRDNGAGYTEDILNKLKNGEEIKNEEGVHIGIRNVKERLEMIYGKRSRLVFKNDNGAVTAIYIPLP